MAVAMMIIGGLFMIFLGIGARLGYFKTLYLFKGFPGYPSGYVYAFIPLGFAFIFLAFVMLQPNPRMWGDIVIYTLLGVTILSFIFMTVRPRWLKPVWLRWLEDQHAGSTLNYLLEEARNTWNWETEPKTQQDVEDWAKRLTRNHI